jgi:hypothetical protein
MPESIQIIIGILVVLIVYILCMLGTGWWTRHVCLDIIRELEGKGTLNAPTAVPYDKITYFKIGYRDYRPKHWRVWSSVKLCADPSAVNII